MPMPIRKQAIAAVLLPFVMFSGAAAQSPWERPQMQDLPPAIPEASPYPPAGPAGRGAPRARPNDAYIPPPPARSAWGDGLPGAPETYPPAYQGDGYRTQPGPGPAADAYRTAPPGGGYGPPGAAPSYGAPSGTAPGYGAPGYGNQQYSPPGAQGYGQGYGGQGGQAGQGYGAPYQPAPGAYGEADAGPPPGGPYGERRGSERPPQAEYSQNEVLDAGHQFFGSISKGLANAIEYVFQQSGRPNGYILGEDAGGAFVAGLRYGEGVLYTKDAGRHRVYWQGPSLGYDFGGEGSKTMVLVYNLRDPSEIYNRFGGVQGSAYVIGGVSVQFQKHGDVVLAPIRSGLGLRLGANVGYLKYTREPTWNPF